MTEPPRSRQRAVVRDARQPRAHVVAHTLEVEGEQFAILEWSEEPAGRVNGLTSAERDVMESMLRGLSNRQIAAARGTSDRTVANQVARIFRKLRISSRLELFARFS